MANPLMTQINEAVETRKAYDRERSKAYYQAHKAEIQKHNTEYMRVWRKENYEKIRPRVLAEKRRNYLKHKDEILAHNRAYKLAHPEDRKRWAVQWKNKVKLEVIAYYSNKTMACARCGFDDIRSLTIDHVTGGGSQHRRQINGYHIPAWLRKNGYPEGYQVLCMNCQFIKKAEEKEYG